MAEAEALKCQRRPVNRRQAAEVAEVIAEALRPLDQRDPQLARLLPGHPARRAGRAARAGRRRLAAARPDRASSPTSSACPPTCPTRCSGSTTRDAADATTCSAGSAPRPPCRSASRWEQPDEHAVDPGTGRPEPPDASRCGFVSVVREPVAGRDRRRPARSQASTRSSSARWCSSSLLVAALTLLAKLQTSSAQTSLNNVQSQGHGAAAPAGAVHAGGHRAGPVRPPSRQQLTALMSGDVDWTKLMTAINAAAPRRASQ